jgi:stress-induced morphogen
MFRIYIESHCFVGKSLVQQHRCVNDILKDDIRNMHGLQLITRTPPP